VKYDLLNCPFCGYDITENDPLDTVYSSNSHMTLWQVVCCECSATVFGVTKKHAIENWNKRVL
jgi:hypothetical protein